MDRQRLEKLIQLRTDLSRLLPRVAYTPPRRKAYHAHLDRAMREYEQAKLRCVALDEGEPKSVIELWLADLDYLDAAERLWSSIKWAYDDDELGPLLSGLPDPRVIHDGDGFYDGYGDQ